MTWSLTATWVFSALFLSRSSFNAVNAAIAISGLANNSSVAYKPCLRIEGELRSLPSV